MARITQNTAKNIAKFLLDKKARNILVLDLRKVASFTSFFILCTGMSSPHLKSIEENLMETLKKKDFRRYGTEGTPESRWILMDYGDIMVHIFEKEARNYYNLERMWADAKVVWKSGEEEE